MNEQTNSPKWQIERENGVFIITRGGQALDETFTHHILASKAIDDLNAAAAA